MSQILDELRFIGGGELSPLGEGLQQQFPAEDLRRVAGKEVLRRPRLIDPLFSRPFLNRMPTISEESDP